MSRPDMPPGGSAHKVIVCPGYFHSQHQPGYGQSPQPSLSTVATSSSSGPMNQPRAQPRTSEVKLGNKAEKDAAREQSIRGWELLKTQENRGSSSAFSWWS
eukprot:12242230-Prorocentrum_lima.AAC.1